MDTPILHEDHWRWRKDDGGEGSGGATWHENEDTQHSFDLDGLDVNVRLRFSLHVTAFNKDNFIIKLQHNLNDTGFVDTDETTTVARITTSTNFIDGDDTTEHGVTFVGTGAFHGNNDGMDDATGSAGSTNNDVAANDYEAVEFCFQLRASDLSDSDLVEFRIIDSPNTVFDNYPAHASAIISLPAGGLSIPVAMASYRRQHERGR